MKSRIALLIVLSLASSTSLFAALSVSVAKVPVNAIQNLQYSGTFSATGGSGTYTFSLNPGPLPAGLTFNATSGAITGAPTAAVFTPYPFTVKVTDTSTPPLTATASMIIYVAPAAGPSGTNGVSNNIVYPLPTSSAGVIDVKAQYGAAGNGITDDSSAIQQAISAVAGSFSTRDTIIYFPAGTYKVSAPLVWGSCSLVGSVWTWTWSSYISLVGHNKADTIIKLADTTSAFVSGNPNPTINYTGCTSIGLPSKAVIFTGPNAGLGGAANTNIGNASAFGNTGFRNHIMNLTVDTGMGNTGAIGIDYLGSNNCRLSDVNIVSDDGSGDTGLSMQRKYQGPDLIKNVTIAGFTTGIAMAYGYANWLEHIVLNRQATYGVYFPSSGSGDVATIRDLKSNNSVPAVTNASNSASLSLIDSTLQGGSGSNAVNNTATAPRVFLRNTSESGYSGLVSGGTTQSCGTWTEWTSNTALSAITASPTSACSLNLAVSETPVFSNDDYTASTVVSILTLAPGIVVNDQTVDNSTLISNAINNTTSSANTIYFPYGTYYIGNPIQINIPTGGHVKRLVFFGSKLSPRVTGSGGFSGSEAIDIQKTLSGGFVFQNLLLVKNGGLLSFPQPAIQQEATATAPVVILNSEDISYTGILGAGTVYLESVNYGPFVFNGQNVYARHLNPELSLTHVTATGGSVWILGLKTENRDSSTGSIQPAIPIGNVSGSASFEVLGASIYGANSYDASAAMFTLSNSSVSISSMTTGVASGGDYDIWASETRNSQTGSIFSHGYTGICNSGVTVPPGCNAYSRPTGSALPLYIGH